ncbi:hypothetical protein BE18_49215 [Sorangium cellulosum]|uniref:Uncharacterized protein n=1 Tax=Sorangium cellulosum TaxID=56 RepID=A0A150R5Z9_SORCE|nr:hypothetical protein BE18_49215 [Sorangium cellulosum]
MTGIAAKAFERSSQTVALCSEHLPGVLADGSQGGAGTAAPGSLLDVEHDFSARVRMLLGDPTPALVKVESDLEEDMAALVGDAIGPRESWTPEFVEMRYTERLEELLQKEPTAKCLDDPTACPWGSDVDKANDALLARQRLVLRALRLKATLVKSFAAAKTVAESLGAYGAISLESRDAREKDYKSAVDRLLKELEACAAPRSTGTPGRCFTAIVELPRLEGQARGELRALEAAASNARVAFVAPTDGHLLDSMVGRYRQHVSFLANGAAAAQMLSAGKRTEFLELLAQREGRLAARFAFRGLRSALTDLNYRLDRLDDKLYGAITVGSLFGGSAVNDLLEEGIAKAGEAGADLLSKLRISPESVLQEACSALLLNPVPDRGLLQMDALYTGIVKGLGKRASGTKPLNTVQTAQVRADTAAPGAEHGARSQPVSPPASPFQLGLLHAAAVTEWTMELSHQVAHGAEANPPPMRLSEEAQMAFYEELLRRPDLLRAALEPEYPPASNAGETVGEGATESRADSHAIDMRIASEVTMAVLVRLEARSTASIDTTGLARQIEAIAEMQMPILESNKDVIEAIERTQGTFLDAQTVNAMCSVLHENPMIRARGIRAWCVDRTIGNAIGAIELSGASKNRGLFATGKFRLSSDSGMPSSERDQVDDLNGVLEYIASTLDRVAKERPQLRFSVRVEGFASSAKLPCTALADVARIASVPTCTSGSRTCFGPNGQLRIDDQDIKWPGSGRDACGAAAPDDGNAALALLRAWTVAEKLRNVLCGPGKPCSRRDSGSKPSDKWQVDPELTLVPGRGSEENQTVRIYVRRRPE